jgi:hypothetical protein
MLTVFWIACDARPRPRSAAEKEEIRKALEAQHKNASEDIRKFRMP